MMSVCPNAARRNGIHRGKKKVWEAVGRQEKRNSPHAHDRRWHLWQVTLLLVLFPGCLQCSCRPHTVLSHRGMNTQQGNLQRGSRGFKSALQVSEVPVHSQPVLFRALVQPCRCLSCGPCRATPLWRILKGDGTCNYSSHNRQTLQMPMERGGDTFTVGKVLGWFFF